MFVWVKKISLRCIKFSWKEANAYQSLISTLLSKTAR